MSMTDFHLINGEEPTEITKMYSCYDSFKPEISYGRYNFHDMPTITQYNVVQSGENFEYEVEQLVKYKDAAARNHMEGEYEHYNKVESLFCLLYAEDKLDVMLKSTNPDHLYGNPKDIYRMIDGTLMVTFMTGELYFTTDEPIKTIVGLMKDAIGTAEEQAKSVIKQYKEQKVEWSKVFLHYPQHSI